jgi:flagellar motility protein MotE (MotC chaperone)
MTQALAQHKPARGTLHIIAALLLGSAVLRLSLTGTDVVAESAPEPVAAPVQDHEEPAEDTHASIVTDDADTNTLLAAFREREQRLVAREAQLTDRLQALRIAEAEITEKLSALTAAEEALRSTIALADTAAEADLARLAVVYENMKPKVAAELFTEMSPEFAAGFLGMMQPAAAAAIMTELDSSVSYSISVMLAGRNALVPTQ